MIEFVMANLPSVKGISAIGAAQRFNLKRAHLGSRVGARAVDWKDNLKRIIDERGLDYKTVALRAGLNEGYVSKVINKVADPGVSVVRRIADALELGVDDLLGSVQKTSSPVNAVPVLGEIAAGHWIEQTVWDVARYEDVSTVPSRFPSLKQSAWKVIGTSMDLAGIADGSFVITVPYYEARGALTDGDTVVVEEHDAGRIRRTCKKIYGTPASYQLRPCSSHPHDPIIILPPKDEHESVTVAVVGLVIGSYMPIG